MKHLLTLIFILTGIFIFSPLWAQQLDEAVPTIVADRAILTGRVTDAHTSKPLSGASVYIPDIKAGVITDADGSYTLINIPPGRHLVEVSFVGYATWSEYISIRETMQKDFALAPSILENKEVVVTGATSATPVSRSPFPVTVVKKQEMLQNVATNLVDVISRKPGVSQLSTGPAISKPVIRGLGYNRVVVINDGVRQEGQQWGDEHGLEIDEYSVRKIEILKGPASIMYGSDAMAGVVNIVTNVPAAEGTIGGNIYSNYQTNNRLRGAGLSFHGNSKGFSWNAWASLKAAADYANKYDGRVYNSKFNERNVGGYAGYNGTWGYTHLIVSNFNQRAGIVEGDRDEEGRFIKPLPGGAAGLPLESDFNSTDPQVPFQHIKHFKAVSDNSFHIGGGRLGLNIGYQRNQRMEYGNADDPAEKELHFDLQTVSYQLQYHLKETNSWQLSFGGGGMFQTNKNKGEEVLIPEYDLFDIGVFTYARKQWEATTLSGGVRFDSRHVNTRQLEEDNDIKFVGLDKQFSNFSGSIGLTHQFARGLTGKINLARGFRAPNIPELSSNGTHEGTNRYEYGRHDLKSESSLQADLGVDFNSDHISAGFSLFYNNIDNFIFYHKLESGNGGDSLVAVDGELIPAFRFDQRKARLAGLELVVDIHPHPLDWLHVENTFSLVNGRFKEALEGTRNMPLIPAARLVSELRGDFLEQGRRVRNLSVKLQAEHNFQQDNAFTGYDTETPTDSYTLFNAGISADIMGKSATLFSLYFTVMNIGDVAWQSHLSRLKYTAINPVTNRAGVFNAGRNFSFKINVPLSFRL